MKQNISGLIIAFVMMVVLFAIDPVVASAVVVSAVISFACYKYVKRVADEAIERYFNK